MNRPAQDKQTTANAEELREQVERTRAELGRTVEALAAQADVKARVKGKAAEVKEEAAVRAHEVKAKASDLAHRAQDKLPDTVRDTASAQAARAGRLWDEKAPEPVRQKAAQGTRAARDHRALLLATVVAGAVVVWRVRRHGKG
ncbi:DUF3618 domain-containing protein [Streptomyces sp. NPDC126499]|uniref:DUF3618 domain-containing protein n=1 Tax=Streptomyces sp. NPDC126499 TaxID=3155314 RepID=UPI00332D943E